MDRMRDPEWEGGREGRRDQVSPGSHVGRGGLGKETIEGWGEEG